MVGPTSCKESHGSCLAGCQADVHSSTSLPLPTGPGEALGEGEVVMKVSEGGAQLRGEHGWILPDFPKGCLLSLNTAY